MRRGGGRRGYAISAGYYLMFHAGSGCLQLDCRIGGLHN
jgi:hypothetical protein